MIKVEALVKSISLKIVLEITNITSSQEII